MDLSLRGWLVLVLLLCLELCSLCHGNPVFPVHHKFKGQQRSLSALKSHDFRRRGRFLSAVDINLGGNGNPTETGLYYAKIGLGTPSNNYYVQVDTGSDILWVNCVDCTKCPKKSDIGIDLMLFDPKSSSTASMVSCGDDFCNALGDSPIPGCGQGIPCNYNVLYGDGSSTAGYFVKDVLQFDQVTGNLQTAPGNSSVIFGCGAKQSGGLGSSAAALDGILGFGQANTSMISQLAASGKVQKMFSHCLDNINGGGIFAIGELVEPRVNTTPMVPNQAHYNVIMTAVEVGGEVLEQIPTDVFETGNGKGTIIDSGTTLAYLADQIFDPLMNKILASHSQLKLQTFEEQFTCFQFDKNVDDSFPIVTFHFEDSLRLVVYPHDYLFESRDNFWCFGFQKSGLQSKEQKDLTLLGDIVLSNKVVLYDIENQGIGWREYNCSTSIKVKDEKSGVAYQVGAHNISSAASLLLGKVLALFVLLFVLLNNFIH